ncbi:MAG: T9SS type A sorting domain-containing protein [Flavobacterium sp.]|nr:T9SS type A sorting domain-containing protein [Flavobacterium sp.]
MKKITSKIFLAMLFLVVTAGKAQCLTGTQFPTTTWTPECNTINPNVIVTNAWAGEYSLVNVISGETYTFASSVPTDYITISTDDGATASTFGVTPLTWTSDVTGVIRYYFHLSDLCGTENLSRIRTIACGTPPCVQPQVTFSKTFDCGTSTFEVTADITDLGSASTITVSDDQSSPSQSVSSAGPVTFGPYPFGTAVVLTATNDDTPICNVVSPSQVVLACPPSNDECDGAIGLTVNPDASCANTTPGSVIAATASNVDEASCAGTEDDDVWFSFVAESTAQKISLINVAGSTTDLFHSLWTGDCSGLSLVSGSCSDADSSTPSGLTVGQTYYVRVYSYTGIVGQTTTFDICIGTPPPPPANDDCVNAVVLNCGDVLTAQVTDSALGGTATSCVGTIGNDIWYSYVGDGQIITLTATGIIEEPQVEVYASTDGTCAGFTAGSCIASGGTGAAVVSVTFVSVVGTSYFVHVGNWINGDPGVTFDLSITCDAPPTPPANDDCSGAESLTINPDTSCTVVTPGTIEGATASSVDGAACGGTEDDDVWYSFVAENTAQIISLNNIAGSTLDLYHSLWSGDCGTLTLVPNSCSDANNSTPSGLVIGQTYYLRIYSFGTAPLQNTTFDVCIATPPPPPANDECIGAIGLTVNPDDSCASFESGTVQSATASAVDDAACTGTEDDDVWYSFVATDVLQTIKLSNIVGSSTALGSSVWSGDCATLSLVAGSCSESNLRTVTGLTAGETYYVRVFTTTATTGQNTTFDICIGTPPPPPANDDCSGAIEITAGGTISSFPVAGSTVSATNSVGLPALSCVATNRSNDVWYSVVVPASGSLTIETAPAPGTVMTDSVLTIFSGTCGSLVEIGCDDDSSASGNYSLEALTGLTPGDVIYIGVWRYGTTLDGDFLVSAYDASLLSNSSFENENFRSYPNPVKDVLNLSYNKTISNVSVFNLLGQEVMIKSINANQSQIDMSQLSAGTYLVKITADNQSQTIKVIKE